jgi:hypothetical protein
MESIYFLSEKTEQCRDRAAQLDANVDNLRGSTKKPYCGKWWNARFYYPS